MASSEEPTRQCAALPLRRVNGRLEVLLVTSRETKRWVIPKGWLIAGLTAAQSAAREAHEEAGVEGRIAPAPLGSFVYEKRLKDGVLRPVRVEVFRLDVEAELDAWPEAVERSRRWMAPAEAAMLVAEPELAVLLQGLE